jgi:EAL domain-containing protein (putative c-di-GMP-specific phosphodiesterase class I)
MRTSLVAAFAALCLSLPASAPELAALRVRRAQCLSGAGRGPEAAEAWLLAALDAPGLEAGARRRLAGEQLLRSGHIDRGLALLAEAMRGVAPIPRGRVDALAMLALGRARLAAEPIVDAPTGLAAGLHLRAEFRSLFAVADLVDYLPDVVEDDAAADALNAWLAAALRSGALPPGPALAHGLQLRIAPVQLRRIRSLAPVVVALLEAGGGTAPCLMLPEAAVHRDAYLVIDAAPEVAALGATLGIDDYRGLLPPQQLAQAGIGVLRLHRSLVRELGERAFAGDRLSDLLARARAVDLSVLVTGRADRTLDATVDEFLYRSVGEVPAGQEARDDLPRYSMRGGVKAASLLPLPRWDRPSSAFSPALSPMQMTMCPGRWGAKL